MAIIKTIENSVNEDMENLETVYTTDANVKSVAAVENRISIP